MFGGLLAYLSRARGDVLELIDRAARLHRSPNHPRPLEDFLVPVRFPWWIAPLPVRFGGCETAEEAHALVGWSPRRWRGKRVVLIALFACVALQIRVAMIANASALVPISSQARLADASIICTLVSLAVVLTIFVAGRWAFWASAAGHPSNPPHAALPSRRAFLLAASAGLVVVPRATLLGARKWPGFFISWLKHPRFRAVRHLPARLPVAPGFVLNNKRNVIHYAVPAGGADRPGQQNGAPLGELMKVHQSRGSTPKAAHFENIPLPVAMPTREAQPHVNRSARAGIVERAAEDLWTSSASDPSAKLEDRRRACALLRDAVLQELQQPRAHEADGGVVHRAYRLARYLILLGDEAALGKLVEAIQVSALSGRFEVAIRSWIDADCRWRKRLRHVSV